MKKALQSIVLLGAVTGVAQAETAVQLYGIADGGVQYKSTKVRAGNEEFTKSESGIKDNNLSGSRWGLKGTEDLGNGTAVIFKLESGFSLGTGQSGQGGRLFGRQAVIGLKGDDWGTLTVGRQDNVADDFMGDFDAFGTALDQASANSAFGDSLGYKIDAAVKYLSPEWSGFQFGLAYGGNRSHSKASYNGKTTADDRNADNVFSAGLKFETGPFAIAASFDRFRVDHRTIDDAYTYSSKSWNIGTSYDFEVVKLYGLYGEVKGYNALNTSYDYGLISGLKLSEDDIKLEAGKYRQKAWAFGLSVPVAETGKLMFSYQGVKAKDIYLGGDSGFKRKAKIFSVGYTQDLSKRTTAYASLSFGKAKAVFPGVESRYDLKSTQALVGLRHRF